ncbi:uncharacterized protein LOC131215784 [Anopheles bellator]|uniref:uncharacterized protein LOC131215784 n=1 Tax=Anopheles bellator TaxID=139047 RepID=UPI00264A0D11|nr:uncharacterized protein LOC131215784 [Anopheles bellator]
MLVVTISVQHCNAAILTRAIEAQKTLVEREEQLLGQAKEEMYRRAQNALETSRDAVSSVADQVRYTLLSPWRVASEALERPKLYAKYLLSKSFPKPADEAAPAVVDLNDSEASSSFGQLMSNVPVVRLFFNEASTESSVQTKPSSLIEMSEPSPATSETLLSPSAEPEKITPMKVILL